MYRTIYMYHSNNYNLYFKISLCKLDIYTKKAAKPITKIIINHCNNINSEKNLKNCRRVLSDVRAYNYLRWRSVRLLFSYLARKKNIDIKYFVHLANLGLVVISGGFLTVFLYIFTPWRQQNVTFTKAPKQNHIYTRHGHC